MKLYKPSLLIIAMFFAQLATAQFTLLPGTGINSYFGDLKQSVAPFSQIGLNASMGMDLNLSTLPRPFDRFHVQGNITYIKLNAEDKDNSGRPDLQARNLSFGSSVFNAQLGFSFDIFGKNSLFNAYPVGGAGLIYFDPYTYKNNSKVFLRDLRTEGQTEKYSRTATVTWMGFGTKVKVEDISIGLEFRYWKTNTDYLDDVSQWGYPNPATLMPGTQEYTWRGSEVGSGPYPSGNGGTYLREGNGLNRGNPKKNDGFTTFQLRIGIPLNAAKAAGLLSKNYNPTENKSEVEEQCEKDRKRYGEKVVGIETRLKELESEYAGAKFSEDCQYKDERISSLKSTIKYNNNFVMANPAIMKGMADIQKITIDSTKRILINSNAEMENEINRLNNLTCYETFAGKSTSTIQEEINALKASEDETFKMWESLNAICPEKTAEQKCREKLEAAIKERNELEEELKDVNTLIGVGSELTSKNVFGFADIGCDFNTIRNKEKELRSQNKNLTDDEIKNSLKSDPDFMESLSTSSFYVGRPLEFAAQFDFIFKVRNDPSRIEFYKGFTSDNCQKVLKDASERKSLYKQRDTIYKKWGYNPENFEPIYREQYLIKELAKQNKKIESFNGCQPKIETPKVADAENSKKADAETPKVADGNNNNGDNNNGNNITNNTNNSPCAQLKDVSANIKNLEYEVKKEKKDKNDKSRLKELKNEIKKQEEIRSALRRACRKSKV